MIQIKVNYPTPELFAYLKLWKVKHRHQPGKPVYIYPRPLNSSTKPILEYDIPPPARSLEPFCSLHLTESYSYNGKTAISTIFCLPNGAKGLAYSIRPGKPISAYCSGLYHAFTVKIIDDNHKINLKIVDLRIQTNITNPNHLLVRIKTLFSDKFESFHHAQKLQGLSRAVNAAYSKLTSPNPRQVFFATELHPEKG